MINIECQLKVLCENNTFLNWDFNITSLNGCGGEYIYNLGIIINYIIFDRGDLVWGKMN